MKIQNLTIEKVKSKLESVSKEKILKIKEQKYEEAVNLRELEKALELKLLELSKTI